MFMTGIFEHFCGGAARHGRLVAREGDVEIAVKGSRSGVYSGLQAATEKAAAIRAKENTAFAVNAFFIAFIPIRCRL